MKAVILVAFLISTAAALPATQNHVEDTKFALNRFKMSEFMPLVEALSKEDHIQDLISNGDSTITSMHQISELTVVRDLSSKYQKLMTKNFTASSGATWDATILKLQQIRGVLQLSATTLRVIAAFDPYTTGQQMNAAVYETEQNAQSIFEKLFWELHKQSLTSTAAQAYFDEVSNVIQNSSIQSALGNWFFGGSAHLALLAIVPYQGGYQAAQPLAAELGYIVAQLQQQ